MPHIVGQDDLMTCITELFDKSELVHTNIENGTFTGHQLEHAKKFEAELQEFTTKTLAKVEALTAIEDKLLA